MKTLIIISSLLLGMNAWAFINLSSGASQNSGMQTYTIHDGYSGPAGYVGHGPTKIAAESDARTQCIQHLVVAYEDGHQGSTPDPDTADLMIDACINK